MDSFKETKQFDLSKLEWTTTSFKISDFLRKYSLPQVVKVIEGFYGDDEESSLGADQVLSLHCIKSTDKVVGRDYRGKEVNIPLHCQNKVEVRPSDLKDVYESVEELCSAFPQYVRVSQGYYSQAKDEEVLNVGDKLYLKNIDKSKKGEQKLICINQNGQTIELPQDCVAGFQPLADGKEYYLAEIVTQFSMPVYVQFIDPPMVMGKQSRSADSNFFNSSLGAIYVESSYTENILIASTLSQDGHRTVVTFPRDIDIRLAVCKEMLQDSPTYSGICQSLNEGIDMYNLNLIDSFSAFKPRNSVREFPYRELIDPLSFANASLQKQEVSPYDEVRKMKISGQKVEATSKRPEVNRLMGYKNEALLQELSRKQKALVGANGYSSGAKDPPQKSQRLIESWQKNGQAAEQPESKNDKSNDSDMPRIEVTNEDNKNAIKRIDVSHYSVKQVSEILKELGMEKYIVKFEEEKIDGEMLMCLKNDILMADFGMNKLHCMKLKKYLEGWRPKM